MSWMSSLSASLATALLTLGQEKAATPEAPAPSPAPGGQQPPGGGGPGGLTGMLPFLLLMGLVFWFLVIGPERKKQKARQALIKNLKKGDQVVTTSGIVGKVVKDVKQEDREIIIQVDRDKDVRMHFLKSAIQDVLPEGVPSEVKDAPGPGKEAAK